MLKNIKVVLATVVMLGMTQGAVAEVNLAAELQGQFVSIKSDTLADGYYMSDRGNGLYAGSVSISGLEELGNGLRGLGRYTVNLDDGAVINRVDEAFVGLAGDFGTLLLGNISTPFKSATLNWDPLVGTFMQARGNGGTAVASAQIDAADTGALVAGDAGVMANSILYSYDFSAARLALMYAVDESADSNTAGSYPDSSTNGNDAVSASLSMSWKSLEFVAAYLDVNDYGYDATLSSYVPLERSNSKVGIRYAADPVTIGLQWINSDKDFEDGSYLLLTSSYRAGSNTYSFNYGAFSDADSTDSAVTVDKKYMALGMTHGFSRNVTGHLGYRKSDIEPSDVGVSSSSETAYGVVLRVKF